MPLGKRFDFGDAKYSGVDVPFTSDIEPVLEVRTSGKFCINVANIPNISLIPPSIHPHSDHPLMKHPAGRHAMRI